MSDLAVTATPPAAFNLVWSDLGTKITSEGPRRLFQARSTAAFDAAWIGGRRSQLRDMGYASKKGDSGWMAQFWAKPSPADEAARAAATAQAVAASRATDAAIVIPAPEGKVYLPYQRAGIAYCMSRPAALVGDEMGLGKTIQAVGVLNAMSARRVLIACPASLKLNWKRELGGWLVDSLPVHVVDGGKAKFPDVAQGGVIVINYDVMHSYEAALRAVSWDLFIADEAHMLKSKSARRTRAVFGGPAKGKALAVTPIAAARRLLLTGTPMSNRPVELHPLLSFLDRATWGDFFSFAKRYCAAHQTRFGWDFDGASHLDELQERLRATVMVRRLKADVLTELPAKVRQVVPLEADTAALRRLLREEEAAHEAWEALKAAGAESRAAAFAELSKAREKVGLAKAPMLAEHVLRDEGPVVVFAHHRSVVDALVAALGEAGRTVVTVTGDMSGPDRQASVDAFQGGRADVIIGTFGAMGVGHTLVRSAHVVCGELVWVPAELSQAEDRCHRIGQHGSVHVEHLVFEGSLDSRLVEVVVEKQRVLDAALDTVPASADAMPVIQDTDEAEKARINARMHARLAEAFALHGALLTPGQASDAVALLASPELPDRAYERANNIVVAAEAAAEGNAAARREREAAAAAEALRVIEAEAEAEATARAERKAAAAAEEEARRAAREAAEDAARERLRVALAAAGWGLSAADHATATRLVDGAWHTGDLTTAGVLVERMQGYVDRAAERVGAAAVLPDDVALVVDPEIRAVVLAGCRHLSRLDADRARHQNGVGWSKTTSWDGHWLAGQDSLDEQSAAVGLGLLRHHQRQLSEDMRERLFGDVREAARPRAVERAPTRARVCVEVAPVRVPAPAEVAPPLDSEPDDAVPHVEVPVVVAAPVVEPEAARVVEEPEPVEEVEPARPARAPKGETAENVAARARLVAVGEAMYGPRWMTDLARDLDVNDRTVRRYDSGATPIPSELWGKIADIARRRRDALDAVIVGLGAP